MTDALTELAGSPLIQFLALTATLTGLGYAFGRWIR